MTTEVGQQRSIAVLGVLVFALFASAPQVAAQADDPADAAVSDRKMGVQGIALERGLFYYVNEQYRHEQGGDVSALIGYTGIAVPVRVLSFLTIAPSLGGVVDEYAYIGPISRAVPTPFDEATDDEGVVNQIGRVWGLVLSAPVRATWTPFARVDLFAALSPTMFFRITTRINETNIAPEVDEIARYLMGRGRFLYPEVQVGFNYVLSNRLIVGSRFRLLFPLAGLWTETVLPDELILIGSIALTFRLR